MDVGDQAALDALQHAYGDAVSRRAWDDFAGLFDPACQVELALRDRELVLDGVEEITRFVSGAVATFDRFIFVLLNNVIVVRDDPANRPTGRMWIQELRWIGGEHTEAYGLYEDTFTRRVDGRWVFAKRRYTSISGGRYDP